jgi:hypothetical protein
MCKEAATALFNILSGHLLEGDAENHEKFSPNRRSLGGNFNAGSLKYEVRALTTRQRRSFKHSPVNTQNTCSAKHTRCLQNHMSVSFCI